MKKRVFIAINLPSEIKNKIGKEIEGLKKKFAFQVLRFSKPQNWHLTISFLGYQDENSLNLIVQALQEVVSNTEIFPLELEKIIYGPPNTKPLMIWILGTPEGSKTLSVLKNKLENKLEELGVRFKRENRQFIAHLTLARFLDYQNKNLPAIEKDISWQFEAATVDLMESFLKRTGAEYEIMAKFKLQDKNA